MAAAALPIEPDELTPEWLTDALASRTDGARVVDVMVSPIAARAALFSRPLHLALTWSPDGAGPSSLVAKLTAADPHAKQAAKEIGVYRQEVRFYDELASSCGLRAPACWFAAATDDTMLLLLDDLTGMRHCDAPAALTLDELERVLVALAAMHARWWRDPQLGAREWLGQRRGDVARNAARYRRGMPRFVELHGDLLDPSMHAALRALQDRDDVWALDDREPLTLVHGDPKPSNIFFDAAGDPVFVDWQGICAAQASADVANALGAGLGDDALECAPRLVDHYVGELDAVGVAVDRPAFATSLEHAARHFVARAVSASVTTDPLFHEAHGVMTRRRIAFALSLS